MSSAFARGGDTLFHTFIRAEHGGVRDRDIRDFSGRCHESSVEPRDIPRHGGTSTFSSPRSRMRRHTYQPQHGIPGGDFRQSGGFGAVCDEAGAAPFPVCRGKGHPMLRLIRGAPHPEAR